MSNDNSFAKRAAVALARLERVLTAVDDDRMEVDLGGDVLALEFDDGRTYIINSHSAAQQVWVAAESRAWHLSWNAERAAWIDTREGRELESLVAELVSRKLGREIRIAAES